MISVIDQIGNKLEVSAFPQRVICLVPSITEYLYDLGLGQRVVGITKFCVHPANWLQEKEVVGGTKQQHLDKISKLKPDLIIASKEENVKTYVEKLAEQCQVYVSDVKDTKTALQMMEDLGKLLDKNSEALQMTGEIKQGFESIEKLTVRNKVAYCIWKKPWMWAGSDTFISSMLQTCGLNNSILTKRYPEVEMEKVVEKQLDYVFLSSEPFPFKENHIQELKEEFPDSKFIIVDGEMFSWYGSRMLKAPDYLRSLLTHMKSEKF